MDILDRLRRSVTKGFEPTDEDAIDAAAEIERLRAENERLRKDNETLKATIDRLLKIETE